MEAVIFDYGGVVIKERSKHLKQDIIDAFGISEQELDTAFIKALPAYLRGFSDDQEFWEEFAKIVDKELPLNYLKLFTLSYETHTNPDVIDLIDRLKGKVKLGCISNTCMPFALYNKARGNYSKFDEVVLSCEVGLVKPDIRIFELMCNMLKVLPHECVFIDDKLELMTGAQELGMRTIHYTGPESLRVINV